jgi:nucleoside-triphosphatase THEP1
MELERRTVTEQELFYSPDSLLASFFSKPDAPKLLVLITGESDAGKTTWCRAMIERALAKRLGPRGLISPAVLDSGSKIAIDLVDIASGERKRLAERRTADQAAVQGKETLNWVFHDPVLAWGNTILLNLPPTDLLIIDEFGPLELLENDGLTNGIKLIDEGQYRLACVVVRPALLATALDRWPWAKVLNVTRSAPVGESHIP